MFQHTAARRRLDAARSRRGLSAAVSTHSRPKAAGNIGGPMTLGLVFQHTAARRRLAAFRELKNQLVEVSTHSRPKAAGHSSSCRGWPRCCFNTQPPEGGWLRVTAPLAVLSCFNTQPPEGGWEHAFPNIALCLLFQHTAARRRLEPLSKALLHQVSQP